MEGSRFSLPGWRLPRSGFPWPMWLRIRVGDSVNSCLASQRGRGGHLEIFADCVQTHHLHTDIYFFLGLSAEKTWKQFTLIETGKPSLQILVSSTVLPGKMVYSRNVPGASRGARKKASAQANTHTKNNTLTDYVEGHKNQQKGCQWPKPEWYEQQNTWGNIRL